MLSSYPTVPYLLISYHTVPYLLLSYHTVPYLVLHHHIVPYLILPSKVLLEEEGEEVQEVQNKLERERRTRMALEERVRLLEGQLYQVDLQSRNSSFVILTAIQLQGQGGRRAGVIQRYSVDDRMETMETMELMSMGGHQSSGGQTILTAAAKKQVCIYVFQFEFVFPLLIVFLYL